MYMLKEFTDRNFNSCIKKGKVIVDFYSQSCIPCKTVEQSLIKIKEQSTNGLVIGRVDVNKNPGLVAMYSITSLPSLLLFKDGKPMEQIIGNVSISRIKKTFQL